MNIPAITIHNLAFQYPRQEGICFKNFNLEIGAGEDLDCLVRMEPVKPP